MYCIVPVCFHLKVWPVGNVRGKESSDRPRLRGTHLAVLDLGGVDKDLRIVLGFLEE